MVRNAIMEDLHHVRRRLALPRVLPRRPVLTVEPVFARQPIFAIGAIFAAPAVKAIFTRLSIPPTPSRSPYEALGCEQEYNHQKGQRIEKMQPDFYAHSIPPLLSLFIGPPFAASDFSLHPITGPWKPAKAPRKDFGQ